MDQTTLTRLADSLPRSFPFYHLGNVQMHEDQDLTPSLDSMRSEGQHAIAFGLHGDITGTLVLLFDQEMDLSTYSELGNIIASQLSTRLDSQEGLGVSISPPRLLTHQQLGNLLSTPASLSRVYLHHHGLQGGPSRLQALIFPQETLGHA